MTDNDIRITVITGSARPGNYTGKAAALVIDELRSRGTEVDVVDLAGMDLAPPGLGDTPDARSMQEVVRGSTGLILATPEYHGGLSSVMKRAIENMGFPSAMAGKPVALLGVAAGSIGAIKSLEMLRSICSHVGCVVLPGPVSIAEVRKKFQADGTPLDAGTEKRVRGLAVNLLDYIRENICPRLALEAMVREGEES
jgi:NAD(P)H-dependent FMN reductase